MPSYGIHGNKMKKNDLIMYAAIAAGAYGVYWYVTSYGPSGPVTDANGNLISGAVSYWNSWFGSAATTTTALPTGTSPVTTATTTSSAPSTTPSNGTVSTQDMATPSQISAIQALIVPADIPAFQGMIPTLTAQQAQSMLANAQACTQGTAFNPANGICQQTTAPVNPSQIRQTGPGRTAPGIAPGGTGAINRSGNPTAMEGLGKLGQIMPLAPNISPATNGVRTPSSLGMITPTPNAMPTTGGQGMGALPTATKSPWGKLPMSGYVN